MRILSLALSVAAAQGFGLTLQEKLDQFRKCREGAPALTNGPLYVDSLSNRRSGSAALEVGFVLDNLGQMSGTAYVVKGDKSVSFRYSNFALKTPQSWELALSRNQPPAYIFASRTDSGSKALGTLKRNLSVSLSDAPHPEVPGQKIVLGKADSGEVLALVRKGMLEAIQTNVKADREISRKLAEAYAASTQESLSAVDETTLGKGSKTYADWKAEKKRKAKENARADLRQATQLMAESANEDTKKGLATLEACKKVEDLEFRAAVEKIQRGG